MHKTELVEAIAKDAGLSRTDAGRAVESFISTVQRTLRKGDEVAITGFGKFSVAKRGADGAQSADGCAGQDQGVQGAEVLSRGHAQAGGQRHTPKIARHVRRCGAVSPAFVNP
jgi:Bacterial DNA-binding protein